MDFAKKLLNKYGWKEGEGLGEKSDGIAKPLRANLKFDNAGLGLDQAASDFNNHWWERVFNEAASNVQVKEGENGVVMQLANEHDAVEISTKGYSVKKLKKASKKHKAEDQTRYDNFLQAATLTSGGKEVEKDEKIKESDIEVKKFQTLTDEELFQACGGRTAHKGARHGLKLSGKLKRLEQQEQQLLEQMKNSRQLLEAGQLAKKIKKKSPKVEAEAVITEELHADTLEKSKKKKKRDMSETEEATAEHSEVGTVQETEAVCASATAAMKKQKLRKTKPTTAESEDERTDHTSKKKRKSAATDEAQVTPKKIKNVEPEVPCNDISAEILEVHTKKARKKRKVVQQRWIQYPLKSIPLSQSRKSASAPQKNLQIQQLAPRNPKNHQSPKA